MPIPLHKLLHLLLRQRLPQHVLPLSQNHIFLTSLLEFRRNPVPFPVKSAGAERGEPRRFSEPYGLDVGVGLGVGVSEVEREVGFERDGLVFGGRRGFFRFRVRVFGGFWDWGEWGVVGFVGFGAGVKGAV